MPLTSHLEELRKRLIRSLIAIGIVFAACYNFKEKLFEILTYPLVNALPENSYMIYTGLPEAFFNYLKISFFASIVLASPFILFQIWKFISPGIPLGEETRCTFRDLFERPLCGGPFRVFLRARQEFPTSCCWALC